MSIADDLDRIRQQDFVTVEEFALLLRISRATVWRRIADGTLHDIIRHRGHTTRLHRIRCVRAYRLAQPPVDFP